MRNFILELDILAGNWLMLESELILMKTVNVAIILGPANKRFLMIYFSVIQKYPCFEIYLNLSKFRQFGYFVPFLNFPSFYFFRISLNHKRLS